MKAGKANVGCRLFACADEVTSGQAFKGLGMAVHERKARTRRQSHSTANTIQVRTSVSQALASNPKDDSPPLPFHPAAKP